MKVAADSGHALVLWPSSEQIEVIRCIPAPRHLQAAGLLAWVKVALGDVLVIDGLGLRQKRGGGLSISYPERRDRQGHSHAVVRPRSEPARRALERGILEALADLLPGGMP